MRRDYFEAEWRSRILAQPRWKKDATDELMELWWREFEDMPESGFRALVDAAIQNCEYLPSVKKATELRRTLARPAIANKSAIDALLLHARIIAEHNSSMVDSTVQWLVEMHTGQAWPRAVTDDRLEELKAMLDRVDDVTWEILTYRSYVMSLGVFEAREAMCRNYGQEQADLMITKAKEAMPGVDAPPTHTTVTYRHGHEDREPELVGKSLREPWYNRE